MDLVVGEMWFMCFSVTIHCISEEVSMLAKQFRVLTATESRANLALVKCIYPPPPHVAYVAVHSKAVVLLLLLYCLMYFPLFVGVLCLSLFCYALLCVHSSFAIILKR